jgi:hypothetical protein
VFRFFSITRQERGKKAHFNTWTPVLMVLVCFVGISDHQVFLMQVQILERGNIVQVHHKIPRRSLLHCCVRLIRHIEQLCSYCTGAFCAFVRLRWRNRICHYSTVHTVIIQFFGTCHASATTVTFDHSRRTFAGSCGLFSLLGDTNKTDCDLIFWTKADWRALANRGHIFPWKVNFEFLGFL